MQDLGSSLEVLRKAYMTEASEQLTEPVLKLDDEKQIVWGWASVATEYGQPVVDRQNDTITVDELRDAVYDFMESRVSKAMHNGKKIGYVVDSILLDNSVQKALGINLGREGWFVGVKVTDPATWAKVKSGEYQAFSIGGDAIREPLTKNLPTIDGARLFRFRIRSTAL